MRFKGKVDWERCVPFTRIIYFQLGNDPEDNETFILENDQPEPAEPEPEEPEPAEPEAAEPEAAEPEAAEPEAEEPEPGETELDEPEHSEPGHEEPVEPDPDEPEHEEPVEPESQEPEVGELEPVEMPNIINTQLDPESDEAPFVIDTEPQLELPDPELHGTVEPDASDTAEPAELQQHEVEFIPDASGFGNDRAMEPPSETATTSQRPVRERRLVEHWRYADFITYHKQIPDWLQELYRNWSISKT